jgi:glycolate oxidase iron-sulfur subunit
MGARGRVAILGALDENELTPSKSLSDKIFSCLLCEACKGLCPTGIDIPETIYRGRALLKDHYRRGRLLSKAVQLSMKRMDMVFTVLKGLQKVLYPVLYRSGRLRYIPEITSLPFKNSTKVYKGNKTIGRVSIFAGCSINYFYPQLGESLLNILLSMGYEVVVLKGEVCCGAPLRAYGLENEMNVLAQKNIGLFSKMQVEAILSLCPTCTLTIRNQYPRSAGGTIEKIMDINEFFFRKNITQGLSSLQRVVTYHDPCHLRYGLGIQEEPREILRTFKKNRGEKARQCGQHMG